ncbi:MAG: BON domain-containing protein [Planctomycetia bacterium]|nr:BON domain-containing protein [Planctomycetia bacterium]
MDKTNLIKRFFAVLFLVGLIAGSLGCAGTSKRESTGEYVDSSVLTSKVKAAIFNDPMLKVLQINVETFKDVVQLSGFVDSPEAAARAVEVARSVEGVKAVKNNMSVK